MPSAPEMSANHLRATALGLGSGGLMLTFFGLAWWGIASQGVAYRDQVGYWAPIDGIALALVVASLVLLRAVRRLPHESSPASIARGKAIGRRLGKRFGLIFGLEIVMAAAVFLLVHVVNHAEYFVPLLAIIVGVHFLPLASLYRVPAYYVTGVALCLAGLLVLLGTPSTALLGRARLWEVLPGLLCGPLLWLTAIYDLVQTRQLLMRANKLLRA